MATEWQVNEGKKLLDRIDNSERIIRTINEAIEAKSPKKEVAMNIIGPHGWRNLDIDREEASEVMIDAYRQSLSERLIELKEELDDL